MIKFFLLSIVLSNAVYALEGICLKDSQSLSSAKSYVSPFLLANEKVFKRESLHCLEFKLKDSTRIKFIETILNKRFSITRTYTAQTKSNKISTSYESTRRCRLEFEMIERERVVARKVKVGSKTKVVEQRVRVNAKSSTQLLLTEGKPGSLYANGDDYYIVCEKRGRGYEITLSVELGYGEKRLSTAIRMNPNERLNIGGSVKDLSDRKRKISLDKGLNYQKDSGSSIYDYYLYIR